MKRLDRNIEGFIQYGLASDLAERAAQAGLTVSKARTLSGNDLVTKFDVSPDEAKAIKTAVTRQPIDEETLHTLLERSNYLCNICKGMKSKSFIVHHLKPYALSQDNDYRNLIVLCPADHDLAHNGGLSLGISEEQLERAKDKWEAQVEVANAASAARRVEVNDAAIDYINIRRIEELCLQLFGRIPETEVTAPLTRKGILDEAGNFQQKYVQERLSGGKYLFDYINSGEALHYRALMGRIAEQITFEDMNAAIDSGKRKVAALEGRYAFFIGGVWSNRPDIPFTPTTPAVYMRYKKRKVHVEWTLDPNYLFSMSAISRQGSTNRYVIYSLVRTVDTTTVPGTVFVKASPLLIAQPSTYANRIPPIGWESRYRQYADDEVDDPLELDDEPDGDDEPEKVSD